MKAKIIKQPVEFTPITLELQIESQAELNFLILLLGNLSIKEAENISGMIAPDGNLLRDIYNELAYKKS